MQWRTSVLALILAVGCQSSESAPDATPAIDADVADSTWGCPSARRSSCNPVSQAGCCPGERCTHIVDDVESGAGHVDCAPDGDKLLGEACSPATEVGGSDDCVKGTYCFDGVCREICTTVNDQCTDGVCIEAADGIGNPLSISFCIDNCDPLAQDCARPSDGCYLVRGEFVCVPAGDLSVGQPCDAINECAPGLLCTWSGGSDYQCRATCGPWSECWDVEAQELLACGCGSTAACAAEEICFAISDGMGGIVDDTVGYCRTDEDAGCDCSADPICTFP